MPEQPIVTLAERPDLWSDLWSFSSGWPRFMLNDPVGELMSDVARLHPDLQLLMLDGQGAPIAKAMCVPFRWEGASWQELPDRGWDAVLEQGVADARDGREPTAVSALEISIRPHLRGTGLSAVMLAAMRSAVERTGLFDLLAPVRPSAKAEHPHEPMVDYIQRFRDDGLPFDPWLRVHARAGAAIVKIAPLSMVVPGTLEDWRLWTGLPFDASGEQVVPGALSTVHVNVDQNHAVYVEPNVWMHHPIG